jgi:diaminopimelate decarboxylase
MIAKLNFLTEAKVREIMKGRNNAVYVVSRAKLKASAEKFQDAISKLPFGGKVKYAMKANPNPEIIKLFNNYGIGVDASSFYEAKVAIESGVSGSEISLTSQELPPTDQDFKDLINAGVWFNATSLHQLEEFLRLFPGNNVGVRINPGVGSGFNKRNTTGGPAASFGIWYQYIPEALSLASKVNSKITTLHTHIGTGTDPMEWLSALETTLDLAERLPDVTTVSIGGGFKAAYELGKKDADMDNIITILSEKLVKFKQDFNRELKLEIEPGRLLVVHAGSIISKIIDKTDTGEAGHNFIRVNTGMTEILRPAMYGGYHQLVVVSSDDTSKIGQTKEFIVAGHCCESSDCLTMANGNPEEVEPRELQDPEIGDYLVIEQAGAYCYGMSAVGYNSYPAAENIIVD